MIDKEFRTHGKPFDSKFSNIRDFPSLSRFDDDFEARKREMRSYFDRDRRQQSLPPRRSYFSSTNYDRTYSPPRNTVNIFFVWRFKFWILRPLIDRITRPDETTSALRPTSLRTISKVTQTFTEGHPISPGQVFLLE